MRELATFKEKPMKVVAITYRWIGNIKTIVILFDYVFQIVFVDVPFS